MTGGPLLGLVALVLGILAGERRGGGPATDALVLALGLGGLGLLVRHPQLRRATLVAALATGGIAVTSRALDGLDRSSLAPLVAHRARAEASLTLLEDPTAGRFSARVLARADTVRVGRGRARSPSRTILVVASGPAGPRLGLLDAGDRVTVRGGFRPLDGYDARLRWQHAVARFEADAVVGASPPSGMLMRVANTARGRVLTGLASLPAQGRALATGLLFGDTRAVAPEVIDAFRAAGLTHLLAVSGANVAFVLTLAAPLLRVLGGRGRLVGAAALLVLFGSMTRWEPSVLRAIAMALVAMSAQTMGRPASGPRVLLLAVIVLLLVDPFLVHSVGFLLSAGACAGILWLAAPVARVLRGPDVVRHALATTIAAQVGVLPVLIPVFGTVPLVTVPANLLAVPVAGPLTVWALASGVVGGVSGPMVRHLLAVPTALMLGWITAVARVAARHPLPLDGRALCAVAAVTALTGMWRRLRTRPPVASGR